MESTTDFFTLDNTTFPTRPACFGQDSSNATCEVPSQSMIDFLNITSSAIYRQVYCLNPPDDSCAFGYCPNPDIASPAVRVSTYVATICLAILLLYQPKPAGDAFYGLVLQNYSLMIAAIISIAMKQLTRLHAVFALTVAGSPVSVYLLIHALRCICMRCNERLETIFGNSIGHRGKVNRALAILAVPLWAFIVAVTLQSPKAGWFQQTACDDAILKDSDSGSDENTDGWHDGSVALFTGNGILMFLIQVPLVVALLIWLVFALVKLRKKIRYDHPDMIYVRRAWWAIKETYPFMRFSITILMPFTIWVSTLELGSDFSNEQFTPTLGQILVVSAAIPPVLQCLTLLPQLMWWFIDLTWVRLLTCRRNAPKRADRREVHGDYGKLHEDEELPMKQAGSPEPKVRFSSTARREPYRQESFTSTTSTLNDGSANPFLSHDGNDMNPQALETGLSHNFMPPSVTRPSNISFRNPQ